MLVASILKTYLAITQQSEYGPGCPKHAFAKISALSYGNGVIPIITVVIYCTEIDEITPLAS
jgi:hypothetical protein